MEHFKCPSCKTEMILRNGKYGPFFYCKDHGTISMRAAKVITASIDSDQCTNWQYIDEPFLDIIKRRSVILGRPMDDLQDLVEFYVDDPDQSQDDPDHWMNVRDY